MSYKIEGRDIVVSGFEEGISDSPYKGISDMRNVDIISVPGEASVAFAPTLTTTNYAISGVTYTASNSAGSLLFTYNGTVPLATNVAFTTLNSAGARPTGIAANTAYYVTVVSPTTFTVSASAGGSAIAYTDTGSGTNTFTVINMAQPKQGATETYKDTSSGTSVNSYHYYLTDSNGRVWYFSANTQWVYMNSYAGNENEAGVSGGGNGLVSLSTQPTSGTITPNYLFSFRTANIDYIITNTGGTSKTLSQLTTAGNWSRSWKSISITSGYSVTTPHYPIVSPTDGNIYFPNGPYLGSLLQVAGVTFDPTSGATFVYNELALPLPTNEISQCVSQLGTNILVGGNGSVVYQWDRISTGYTPIFIAENGTYKIVCANTNAYFFSGQRGRIFVTNGSQAELFKKMPDHLSNTVNPYYTWGDAVLNRNQIYFGVQATDNSGTAINQYGGTWAIDLDTKALRLVTEQSYGSYAGITSVLIPTLGTGTSNGFGLLMGWYTSSNTTGGVDKSSTSPYTGGQSYVDSDLIPIGTYLNPFTGSQVEWKVSTPLVSGESIALYWRPNLTSSYTFITSQTSSLVGALSDLMQVNFQKVQWAQIRAVLTSTASTPSYCRLTEFRIRSAPKQ